MADVRFLWRGRGSWAESRGARAADGRDARRRPSASAEARAGTVVRNLKMDSSHGMPVVEAGPNGPAAGKPMARGRPAATA
ncbi:hypothetical protein GCM10017083_34440 [Thalassobaculum fulvum]|uniref:Uncharacterized protein n=1 Tax=Thalassobaculum fulvum TaxID=1633335 RepID=A0A918XUW4_9PROT|nr:hypothetical protein GCM10017083_34440 [Thalassobaculum fulvum]